MSKKIAIIASSIHVEKQAHLLEWYQGLSAIYPDVKLFIGSNNKQIPYAGNFKINSKKEKIKYFLRGKNPHKIQPLIDYKPDVIHLLTSNAFNNILPFIKNTKVKLIVSFRGFDINVFPSLNEKNLKLTQEIFKQSHVLHFISRGLMNSAIELGADKNKCVVIYRSTSVDSDFYAQSQKTEKQRPIKIVSVGRLVWEKGYLYALETLSLIKEKGYDFQYLIAGDGVDYPLLNFHLKRLNLEDNVTFLGLIQKEEVKDLLRECDIYFQPSLSEALSNSIIEASYYKLPVVSSMIGGIPEVVKHNVSGFLTEICNPRKYAENLEKLIKNEQLRKEMGDKGHEIIKQHFLRENEIKSWIDLYHKIS
ncbi:MAG TPA: glycosyltransferase family 4 protein [Flavobacterium sp.]|nr:glycosyltransferase family 4 protein [Flavobacterium sp.]